MIGAHSTFYTAMPLLNAKFLCLNFSNTKVTSLCRITYWTFICLWMTFWWIKMNICSCIAHINIWKSSFFVVIMLYGHFYILPNSSNVQAQFVESGRVTTWIVFYILGFHHGSLFIIIQHTVLQWNERDMQTSKPLLLGALFHTFFWSDLDPLIFYRQTL